MSHLDPPLSAHPSGESRESPSRDTHGIFLSLPVSADKEHINPHHPSISLVQGIPILFRPHLLPPSFLRPRPHSENGPTLHSILSLPFSNVISLPILLRKTPPPATAVIQRFPNIKNNQACGLEVRVGPMRRTREREMERVNTQGIKSLKISFTLAREIIWESKKDGTDGN